MLTKEMRLYFFLLSLITLPSAVLFSQKTEIRGFVDATATYNKNKVSFGFDEQDLFITSQINDRLSFLGESVFKYTPSSPTEFSVSIERIVIKYNIQGNNNIIIGKVHTPLNYWNDSYHHGRVFFPTIDRPLLFAAEIIPLHTTGISLQGHDFGKLKAGYDFVVGNGLGSGEISDDNQTKSITAAVHIKPVDNLRLGISWYRDVISKGATVHDKTVNWKVEQNLYNASVAYFGKKFEVLTEGTIGINHTDTTGSKTTLASYIYSGYRVTEKLVPYLRLDNLAFQRGEIYYANNNTTSIVAGLRYEINYLAVIKLEYQHKHSRLDGTGNLVTAQVAIGF